MNKHLIAASCWFSYLHTLLTMHGHRKLNPSVLALFRYLSHPLHYAAEVWVGSCRLSALESVVAAASSDAVLHAVCVLYLQGTSSTSFVRRRSRGCRKVSVLTELWHLLKDSLNRLIFN